ncbi:probable polygalacturonase At3g15720 [Rhododendron vialii]|uniref:probable polygalacturonase At3g15720 n=1 Tax=Rhododendron vialii TaxID=182163 RepID=UPI00265E1CCB|nr:probable polygalacturonase At3g15720 [Rhododendron vialii]
MHKGQICTLITFLCFQGAKCSGPSALAFTRCDDLILNGLTHINSPRSHISIKNCKGVIISNLHIIAPQTSPNTDGIDISGSSFVIIRNCTIGTGKCIQISLDFLLWSFAVLGYL